MRDDPRRHDFAEQITLGFVDQLVLTLSVKVRIRKLAMDMSSAQTQSGGIYPILLEAVLRAEEAVLANLLAGRALEGAGVFWALCTEALFRHLGGYQNNSIEVVVGCRADFTRRKINTVGSKHPDLMCLPEVAINAENHEFSTSLIREYQNASPRYMVHKLLPSSTRGHSHWVRLGK